MDVTLEDRALKLRASSRQFGTVDPLSCLTAYKFDRVMIPSAGGCLSSRCSGQANPMQRNAANAQDGSPVQAAMKPGNTWAKRREPIPSRHTSAIRMIWTR